MTTAFRFLATASVLALSAMGALAQGTPPQFRPVQIPDVPTGAVCADDKTTLIERASSANSSAAENAQTAMRALAERQAAARPQQDAAEIDRLRAERDRRTEEWRRAETVFDAAVRVEERQCPPGTRQADTAPASPPPPVSAAPSAVPPPVRTPPASTASRQGAPLAIPPAAGPPSRGPSLQFGTQGSGEEAPPVAQAPQPPVPGQQGRVLTVEPDNRRGNAPPSSLTVGQAAPGGAADGGGSRPEISLALSVSAPERCQPNEVCQITVEIENRGTRAFGSPLLASVALGSDLGTIAQVSPEAWACGRGGESLSCTTAGFTLEPDTRTRFTVDWRLPARLRRPTATVCARVVWPGQESGSVYRAEQVAALQYALTRAGFETGGITGRIGPRTLDAIRQLRSRANIGGTGISPELLDNLFGANAALTGDDDASNDNGCTTVSFGGAGIAAAPPASRGQPDAGEAAEAPPAVRRAAPQAPAPQQRARLRPQPEMVPREQAVRRRPQPVQPRYEDEEDDVVIYRTPQPRYLEPRYVQPRYREGTVIYGPNGPVVVYPGAPYGGGWGGAGPYYRPY